jgi:hypothetical protein
VSEHGSTGPNQENEGSVNEGQHVARRTAKASPAGDGRIVDIDVSEEMRSSFLEYAYSVI